MIAEQHPTIAAKLTGFGIHVTDAAAVVHETPVVLAVPQIECVPQFMGGLFDDTHQIRGTPGNDGDPTGQAAGGDDTARSPQLRFAVNVGKNRDKKIVVGQGNDFMRIQWGVGGQFFKNRRGVELPASGVPGKIDIVDQRLDVTRQTKNARHHLFDGMEDIGVEIADGRQENRLFGNGFQETAFKMGSAVGSA